MIGMTKEQVLQLVSQKVQANTDLATAIAEVIEENNRVLSKQVEEIVNQKAQAKSHPFDIV